MIKEIWPCVDSEIKKGRWKVSRCNNEDIKIHAECIFLKVFGHPLHNVDYPLYFAKMLYVQFVQTDRWTLRPKKPLLVLMTYVKRQ